MALSKNALLAAVSATALIGSAPVWAADTKASTTSVKVETVAQVKAEDLIGKDIKNLRGDDVGEIESVIIDRSGKVAGVIVGIGGFLGLGERHVAMDWNELLIRENGGIIQTNMTKADLERMPEYKYGKPENRRKAFVDNTYLENRDKAANTTMADKQQDDKTMAGKPRTEKQMAKAEWVSTKELRTSKLIGVNVVNAKGETIGEVEDVILSDNRPQLVLSVGEFLGMGGHYVKVDLAKAKIQRQPDDIDDLRVSVPMSKKQLEAEPKFDLGQWEKRKASAK